MDDKEGLENDSQKTPQSPNDENQGHLVALRTLVELKAADSVVDVYITKVSAHAANSLLNRLRSILGDTSMDLQHLRRFATLENLPDHLRCTLTGKYHEGAESDTDMDQKELFLFIAPTSAVELPVLKGCLSMATSFKDGYLPVIYTVPVPLLAPTSQRQASAWSLSHWPTVYKKNNPFGPHPSIVSRAEIQMVDEVSVWMSMAKRVALDCRNKGIGEAIGAVIVDRGGGAPRAVALAGDARWNSQGQEHIGTGNVMAHAVLRAIAMVARKVMDGDHSSCGIETAITYHQNDNLFPDKPIGEEERTIFKTGRLSPGGYLCHNLEIYLTHEPCVMCSMAILHSRFGRVVFGQRMPLTGGLCGEIDQREILGGLGHGLFWRRELNWCLMAWQYTACGLLGKPNPEIHA